MSRTTAYIDVPAERVFDLLDDPWTYEFWVVGCKDIRGVDPGWPAVGAAFHHSVGLGPLTVSDHTSILDRERPRRLRLEARARPAGIAHVIFDLSVSGTGTDVVLREAPVSGPAALVHNPLLDRLIHQRNVETLRRLKWLAERESR